MDVWGIVHPIQSGLASLSMIVMRWLVVLRGVQYQVRQLHEFSAGVIAGFPVYGDVLVVACWFLVRAGVSVGVCRRPACDP